MMEGKKIELRSEEVQEVMGNVPVWILRWGITILFVVVLGVLIGSFYFKYPDVMVAEMILTSRNPVVEVVARTSGKISHLYVPNGQEVKSGVPIAVIENTANTEDVFRLKKILINIADEPERLAYYQSQNIFQLGDIQSAYTILAAKDVSARDYRASVGQLLAAMQQWEMNYCLIAPITGKIQFIKQGYTNLYMNSGETFCRIVPDKRGEWIGRAMLPTLRSGKVKVGQRVIVRFSNYPDHEFGIVNGKVLSISLVPTGENYVVEIIFPKGMTTNYGIKLPVTPEIKASAEIVTSDLRLIERLFQPIRRVFNEGF